MPSSHLEEANFQTVEMALEPLIYGLPGVPVLNERLPIFYKVFRAGHSDMKGVSREFLRNVQLGNLRSLRRSSIEKLEQAAKGVVEKRGASAEVALQAAKWLSRGSPPKRKASNVAEPKPEEPPKPLQRLSSSPVSVPLLRPLEDLSEAEEKFRKRLRKHGLDPANARISVLKLYSKAMGRVLDWKHRVDSGWMLPAQFYDRVQAVLSRWSGLVDETIHQAFCHLPYEQHRRPKLELINEASDWDGRLRDLVDLAFEDAI